MSAYRLLYQQPGASYWLVLHSAYHTEQSAAELCAKWNRKDRGRYQWKYEVCHKDDFDYPDRINEIET